MPKRRVGPSWPKTPVLPLEFEEEKRNAREVAFFLGWVSNRRCHGVKPASLKVRDELLPPLDPTSALSAKRPIEYENGYVCIPAEWGKVA